MNNQISNTLVKSVGNNQNPLRTNVVYKQFMGRAYTSLDLDPVSHLVRGFFRSIKKGKDLERFTLEIKNFHPINQQALLKKGLEIALTHGRTETYQALQQKLTVLESQNDLTSDGSAPTFNPSYKSTSSLIKIAAAIVGFVIAIPVACFVANKFNTLSNHLQDAEKERDKLRDDNGKLSAELMDKSSQASMKDYLALNEKWQESQTQLRKSEKRVLEADSTLEKMKDSLEKEKRSHSNCRAQISNAENEGKRKHQASIDKGFSDMFDVTMKSCELTTRFTYVGYENTSDRLNDFIDKTLPALESANEGSDIEGLKLIEGVKELQQEVNSKLKGVLDFLGLQKDINDALKSRFSCLSKGFDDDQCTINTLADFQRSEIISLRNQLREAYRLKKENKELSEQLKICNDVKTGLNTKNINLEKDVFSSNSNLNQTRFNLNKVESELDHCDEKLLVETVKNKICSMEYNQKFGATIDKNNKNAKRK